MWSWDTLFVRRSLLIFWWFTYPSPNPRPHSNRQARCGESSCIAPETAVRCPITRGATGHVRITIVKIQGSIRDIREAWVSLFLASKEKPHLSRHIGNYKTPWPVVEESCVSTRRVLQAVCDPSQSLFNDQKRGWGRIPKSRGSARQSKSISFTIHIHIRVKSKRRENPSIA